MSPLANNSKTTFLKFNALALMLLQVHCGGSHMPLAKSPVGTGTPPAARKDDMNAGPFYESHVLPIFTRSCVACHGKGSPKGNWLDYQAAYAKRDLILEKVSSGAMPMGSKLPEEDKQMIIAWVQNEAQRAPTPAAPSEPEAPKPGPGPGSDTAVSPPDSGSGSTPTADGAKLVTFKDLKQDVFEKHCALCHNSGMNLPDWRSFETAYENRMKILKRVVEEKSMPPAGMELPPEKRELIRAWIESGALYDKEQAK